MSSFTVKFLAVACSYAVLGKLSLLLAIPPGYATAIFPPAGIAFGCLWLYGRHYWPAVFVGSLLLNLWVGWSHQDLPQTPMIAIATAVGLALGAAGQALCSVSLLQHFLGRQSALTKDADIFKFMLIAGPGGCLINASWSISVLSVLGVLPITNVGYSWFHWWVGDAIGVLITAPVLFCFLAKPRHIWRSRRSSVVLPLLFALGCCIVLFQQMSRLEQSRIDTSLQAAVSDTHTRISAHLKNYTDTLKFVARFIANSDQVTPTEFHNFVDFTLADKPGVQGISWNPLVHETQRQQFELAMQQHTPGFYLKEKDPQQQWVTALPRPSYVVVSLIEPLTRHQAAVGYDVYSDPVRRHTMDLARDTGQMRATARLNLVQDQSTNAGILVFHPIYQVASLTPAERQQHLRGFVVGIFQINDMLQGALPLQTTEDLNLQVDDISEGKTQRLFGTPTNIPHLQHLRYTLDVAGRTWQFSYSPTLHFLDVHHGLKAWTLLAITLVITSFMAAFLLSMSGRSHHIAAVVERKTAELRGILDTALESIITVDANGQIESINPAGQQLFGYSANALLGQPITRLLPECPSTQCDDLLEEQLQRRLDTYGIHHNALHIPLEVAMSSFRLVDKLLHIVIVHDLTERQKIDRMKDEFISVISHELRTPLTSIKGALGLLNSDALLQQPEQQKKLLAIAYSNCDSLIHLVNDLLLVNKLQLAGMPLHLSKVSCQTLLEHAVQANQGFAASYHIELAWSVSQNVLLELDEAKILQVLSNLLSNAIKYSKAGQVVQLSTEHHHDCCTILVRDEGCGIPLEFQPHVFDKFAQADSSDTRRVGGTGLGMSISKSYVELHHGTIGFHSTPGQGSVFYITLPLCQPAASSGGQHKANGCR